MRKGDIKSFDNNWNNRNETYYNHWTAKEPINQTQFAFFNHWITFKSIINESKIFNGGKKVLEVGAGRGSASAFFSNNGYQTTLLDSSDKVLNVAKTIFKKNNLHADFIVGNALSLPFNDESFDIVFSIGLLEHFDEVLKPISEQIRVLNKGGIWFGYIVPEMENNVQKDFGWVNEILKTFKNNIIDEIPKESVYRTSYKSSHYKKILQNLNLKNINGSGIYPVPMISNSIDFPFTLMNENAERVLVKKFKEILSERLEKGILNPWLCEEDYGNAILVWGIK